MSVGVRLYDHPVPPTPSGFLYAVDGTSSFHEEQWGILANVAGAFYFDPESPRETVPARGSVAYGIRERTGAWPEPVFVPTSSQAYLPPFLGEIPEAVSLPDPPPIVVPKGLPFDPAPFQIEAAKECLALRRHHVTIPAGLGKTGVGLIVATSLLQAGLVDRIVVVSPAALGKILWEPAIQGIGGAPRVLHGDKPRRLRSYRNAPVGSWSLIPFDTLRTDAESGAADPLFGPRTAVFIDEIHNLKGVSTARWTQTRALLNRTGTEYRVGLTGTIYHDTPVDCYGPIELLGIRTWASHDEFLRRYFRMETTYTGRFTRFGQPITAEAPAGFLSDEAAAELSAIVHRVAYYRTRKELGVQLPPLFQPPPIVVRAASDEEMLYREAIREPVLRDLETMRKQFPAALGEIPKGDWITKAAVGIASENVLGAFSIERQFSMDPAMALKSESKTAQEMVDRVGRIRFEGASPGVKTRALIVLLGERLGEDHGSKVVVFCHSPEFYALLRDPSFPTRLTKEEAGHLETVLNSSLFYTGDDSASVRAQTLKAFCTTGGAQILFATDVGSQGLDGIQGYADTVVHYDDPLSYGVFEQRVARVWRRGTTDRVTSLRIETAYSTELVQDLEKAELPPSMDVRVRELIDYKRSQVRMVVRDAE